MSGPVYAQDTGYPWERRGKGSHVRRLGGRWLVWEVSAQEEVGLKSKVVCSTRQRPTKG